MVEWHWIYRSRSTVIMHDTPPHASDRLCLIWKESFHNCRSYRADTGCGTDGVKPIYPHTTSLWGYNDITIKHSKGVKHNLFAMLDAKRKRSICCLTCHVVIVFREKSFKPIHVLLYSTIDHQPSEVLSDEVTKISSCCRNHITY